ncbi:putative trans-sialidase, Group V [Trypanosoma cruzi]|uniref:Trans-sialidase, putative n=2 Tax=Trypanosoma cruzi TaxID=5693 RepID=Q4CWC5_TRYCC|nr:trans-sialidase, putative [Trypanosoma cruzi]EAN84576.1 trans-sialidase, putative [Trypanosoma cruzi]PWV22140.1 putative trans-sialidase, Group V [Trypanosoma cruzi]RNC49686.1 putative trans-sialidase [Trypanosoma cruzi]|eukprot:XP_806427.1 trans-sialidase [Trypanosoma cruzi strain CL Brener]
MLSRVAAVKAPNAHNRRRVTGSSGRRREGREGEHQRPNMSRHLFTSAVLLLLVTTMCCGSVAAEVQGQLSGSLFKWTGITDDKEQVESLGVPGLLKVGSDVFAIAKARCTKKNGEVDFFTGVASQLLTTTTANKPEEVLNEVKDTQFLEKVGSAEKKKVNVSRPTTVVKENDIYMLVGKYSQTSAGGLEESGKDDCGFLLVKGEVNGNEKSVKTIHWKSYNDVSRPTFGEQHKSLTRLIGSGGSGVEMKDDTLVFPVEAVNKAEGVEKEEKTVSLIIYSLSNNNWKLLKEISDDGCSDPSVVEWRDGKLMMMTACDDGRRRVYESGDKGESWTEALGTLSRVWGNKKGEKVELVGSGFTTAKIGDDRDVMLITLPVYSSKDGNGKGVLHLWLMDNTHIADIGSVSGEGDEDAAASSLLYKSGSAETTDKKEQLIALYEKNGNEESSYGMFSVRLTAQLQRVKDVLKTWKEVDERVSKLCTSLSALEGTSTENACSTVDITDGLVGFLSGNFSENTWRDEYLGVNATVKKEGAAAATVTSDGVTFQGAWAEWPVGEQGENQLYHFANYNFTLVATVSIHGVPKEGPIPFMGVRLDGEKKLMEFSYNKEKKWLLLCDGKPKTEHSRDWEPETIYQVAIVLQNGTHGSAYVDGERVGETQCELKNNDSKGISNFYIGGSGGSTGSRDGVSVTVTNVLLYNRPLDDPEIGAFNPRKASIPPPVNTPTQLTAVQSSPGEGQEEQGQSLGRSGAGGVSTSTEYTAMTSSGEEGSVNQLLSGKTSDGDQKVNGEILSDGEQRSGTEVGDTVQGDGPTVNPEVNVGSAEDGKTARGTDGREEEIHPQNGEVNAAALSSSLGNVSQGNNSDAGTMRGSGLLLLLLLLGLWGFAAL